MTNGHTKAGSVPVELDGFFSFDEVLMFIRALDMALMVDSHANEPPHLQRMDWVAARAILKAMRDKLRKALEEQYPELLKEFGLSA